MVSFVRVGTSSLYVDGQYSQDVGMARVGFMLDPGEPAVASLDPAACLSKGTICLFPTLPAGVAADFPVFAAQNLAGTTDVRLALFTARGELRAGDELVCGANGVVTRDAVIQLGVQSGEDSTGNGEWRTWFRAGAQFSGVGDRVRFEFPQTATKIGICLDHNGTIARAPAGERVYELELTGPYRGRLRFPIEVDQTIAERLGLGMRYFKLGQVSEGMTLVESHHYPLYDLARTERFTLAFDYAAPYEEEAVGGALLPRSMLYLPDKPLASHLHNVHGHAVALAPAVRDEATGLRLARSPTALKAADAGALLALDHYLAPHGEFTPRYLDGRKGALRLSLGLSNQESLTINPDAGDRLGFSHAPALIGEDGELNEKGRHCKTAWTRFAPGPGQSAAALMIDPEGMPSYFTGSGPAMVFRGSRFHATDAAFPLVPLLGLGQLPKDVARARLDLERAVLARLRHRKLISTQSLRPTTPAPSLAAAPAQAWTPQGYLIARPEAAGPATRVTFGRMADPAGAAVDFAFAPRTDAAQLALAEALSVNRLFLVTRIGNLVTLGFDPASLGKFFMAGWQAALPPEAVVILKHDDRPVATLAEAPANWTARETFLPSDDEVQRVQATIRAALADGNAMYAPLQRRLNDPNWNGVLVLNARLPASGIPDQLKALAADLGELPIHHVGIDIASIASAAQDANPRPAAIFGLILYEAAQDKPWNEDEGSLAYSVRRFVLRVANDAVDLFECKVELKLNRLFDVPVQNKDQVLALHGRYESRIDNTGQRHGSYRFIAEGKDGSAVLAHQFAAPSIIQSARLSRIELLTVFENGVPTGRFVLDGAITFGTIGSLDILGVSELQFSSFALDYDIKPFAVRIKYPSIRFDIEGFNRGRTRPRANSLLAKFPFKLRAFRFGDLNLAKLGYFDFGGVRLPENEFPRSPNFRFGFDFDLDLGSLGALAKKLDRFKLQVLVGWKPEFQGGALRNLFAFGFRLDLGEGAGGIDLGLQGLMRIRAERFNLQKVSGPRTGDDIIVMSADGCELEVLGQRLPASSDERFGLFLFADLGQQLFERPGWYASFQDASASPPIALQQVMLGQRVRVGIEDLSSTRDAIAWLAGKQTFGPDDAQKFIDFTRQGTLRYDPDSEWFFAAKGELFDVVQAAVLLRDPDLYGANLTLLAAIPDPPQIDLLYQKLGDGVGRYAAQLMLPPSLRTLDVGAVSVSLGMIHLELYTDGGFLVDLGFPDHVDYSRSFVLQGGPFIGKGGLYISRVPREAAPLMQGDDIGAAFRAGLALRIGLGREFERGPIRAGLSVSVFGRVEGAIARRHNGAGYCVALQGEVGLIAEIEGAVDLRLIRARLFLRIWVANGITLVTGKPVLLSCEAGVDVSVELVIGRIRIFRHTTVIRIRLSYHTRLRFDWELPVRVPPVHLQALSPALAPPPPGWTPPDFARIGVAAKPFQLHLAFDAIRMARQDGPQARVVPSLFWLANKAAEGEPPPFAALGRAVVAWAAIGAGPGATAADAITVARGERAPGAVTIGQLRLAMQDFDQVDPASLQQLLAHLFAGSQLELVNEDSNGPAYLFPVPPGLVLRIGEQTLDFGSVGELSDSETDALMAHLHQQLAEIDARSRQHTLAEPAKRPLVERLFQDWCALLAIATVEELDRVLDESGAGSAMLGTLWGHVDWQHVSSWAGRMFHGGIRTPAKEGGSAPLFETAGLFIEVPAASNPAVQIAGVGQSDWLSPGSGTLELDGAAIRRLATVSPRIDAAYGAAPPVTRIVARGFILPEFARIDAPGATGTTLLCELGVDLRRQLARAKAPRFPDELVFAARARQDAGQHEIVETALAHPPTRCLVFDMMLEPIRADGSANVVPNCYQIAGASESERLGLDALLGGSDDAVAAQLAGSKLSITWRHAAEGGHVRFAVGATDAADVILARSTVSVERRPGPALLGAAAAEPEGMFRATLDPGQRLGFLLLLQRAAIVNSGGTYLVVPPSLGERLKALFALDKKASLSFILEYAPAAPAVSAAVNAVLVSHAADVAAIDAGAAGKLLSARLGPQADLAAFATSAPGLVETVSLRPPGTELLRVWRKAPRSGADDGQIDQVVREHLAAQFDMLEFEVTDDAGNMLLGFDECLPLGSERAVPEQAPEQVRAWLREEAAAAGYDPADLRYDLLLPLARLAGKGEAGAGPYTGVGRKFHVRTGWRDLYGNRLEAAAASCTVQLLYRDPLIPLEAWPGVAAHFAPGQPGTHAFEFTLELQAGADGMQASADGLRKVIYQLGGPGVTLRFESSLAAPAVPFARSAELVQFLRAVLAHVESGAPVPPPFRDTVVMAPLPPQPFLAIDLRLVVARQAALVDPALAGPAGTGGVPGVIQIASEVPPLLLPGEPVRAFATAFQDAFSQPGQVAAYWMAQGGSETGGTAWWAVDARLIPRQRNAVPDACAPPPMARAPQSVLVEGVPVVQPGPDGSYAANTFAGDEERKVQVSAHDADIDDLLRRFLGRIDAFLSPLNAAVTAQVPGPARQTPFERVARHKAAMLGSDNLEAAPLFQFVQGIRMHDGADADRKTEAKRMLREACAAGMERYYDIGCVLVQQFASALPSGWFSDDTRPKLYGRLRFDGADGQALGFRAVVRGIELREQAMQLGIAVFPDASSAFVDLAAHGPVAFECTHVERVVAPATGVGRLAPSRWLTLVPVLPRSPGRASLPLLELAAAGTRLLAPAPLRRIPALPELSSPTLGKDDGQGAVPYEKAVENARRWHFGFQVAAEFAEDVDEFCGRLVYNGNNSSAPVNTETPAVPLYPSLLAGLVAFEARIAPYWSVIEHEAGRRAGGDAAASGNTRFANACTRFAEAVDNVVAGFAPVQALSATDKLLEDRFILADTAHGAGRRTTFGFADHLDGQPRPVLAGEGNPVVKIRQVIDGHPREPSNGPDEWKRGVFDFSTAEPGSPRRQVDIGRLDALRLQSVWAAGSIRRNARINGEPVQPRFVYRTPEIYLQEVLVPHLVHDASIEFTDCRPETLASRLGRALAPVFAGQQSPVPVQVRFDFESGQIVRLLAAVGGDGWERVLPAPDAKLQFAGLMIGEGATTVEKLAEEAAAGLQRAFALEPPATIGRIVIGLLVKTTAAAGQPLLRVNRLVVPLDQLTDLPASAEA